MVAVCSICFFVILPLNLVGTILGRNLSGQPNFPCRVNAVPRPIPEKKCEGQSFFSRFKIWVNILDPTFLLSSDATIKRAHGLLRGGQKLDEWDKEAVTLSLSSVHADSGDVLPLMLRPAAFLSTSAPLVITSFLPHTNVKYALLWQFFLQSYQTRFTLANRNSSSEKNRARQPTWAKERATA
ncbi:hypothetical protein CgunFtcFv8_016340 [Champsocephalus gunnari]|uniref:Uncharacterized protein n=1 Tax=Champsocephalus gunnari TaxID=52237 RepID=A0AAN8CQ02_CHAGU|nr:hypothetical protein CgunFtcFv8_016340 [Champsocephalus gunnari]